MKIKVAIDVRAPVSDGEGNFALFRLESGAFLLHPETGMWLEPKLARAGVQVEHCSPVRGDLLTGQSLAAMIGCIAA